MAELDQNRNVRSETEGSNSGQPVMQQPGEVIAPEVADGVVEVIAEEVYGLKVTKCKQLNGYDDKNYHLHVSPASSNPHIKSLNPNGYVMKIVNTIDTIRPEILYAQIEFMQHLQKRGIATQEAVQTLEGEFIAFRPIAAPPGKGETKTHAVCLRTFLPGDILYDVTLTPDLCVKLGRFQAQMTQALQDFNHPFYDTFDCLWNLTNLPQVKDFMHVISDVKDKMVVEDVIHQFTTNVLPRRAELRAGMIHGDPNEQNILVKPGEGGNVEVCGILDFQDASRTHPLWDLAMLIAYVMLQATTFDTLDVGGHILAGYSSVMVLPEIERKLVRTAAAGRLVQSLVLGAYNHSLDPANMYLLTTAQRGWHVLHKLWAADPKDLNARWDALTAAGNKGTQLE